MMLWLSTAQVEVQRDQPKGYGARQQQELEQLKELEESSPPHMDWSRSMEPTEVQPAAMETLVPAGMSRQPQEFS
jgi:hypothetical protein